MSRIPARAPAPDRLRIAVTGLAATYPYGGVFWDYLQYAAGLRRLGHDVLYVEDTGSWCYDPFAATFVEDGSRNASVLSKWIRTLDPALGDRWFLRDAADRTFGMPWPEVVRFCREADLFLHVSGSCRLRPEYLAAGRVAFVDTDPLYTQAAFPGYLAGSLDDAERRRVEAIADHDVHFSFGENVGALDCGVPTGGLRWHATRQPILLDRWRAAAVPPSARRRLLTTVASWEAAKRVDLLVDGRAYGGKGAELERFLDLPSRSVLPIELALSGHLSKRRLRARGWRLAEPTAVSDSPWGYRSYLARSLGEWSVAKPAYVASRSGWFSCRTACYLALGVPAVVEDTGFAAGIAAGEGVLPFSTLDEAAAAIERLAGDPARHARAAEEIAAEWFDSDGVLTALLETALGEQPARSSRNGRSPLPLAP